jgi:aryl-alcohol dehydrogenase-like predicted oxidoreductase
MHYGVPLADDRYIALVRQAYAAGLRTFITADVYGSGEADALLGRALEGLPRETYCVVGAVGHDFYEGEREGSKGFPRFTNAALRQPGSYADYLRSATESSLERCGIDQFDLLLLHNPDSVGYTSDEVWRGMAVLKESGLAAQLGVAPGPANGFTLDLIRCLERFPELIDWAMVILNPLEPWPGSLCLEAAEKTGTKILTRVVDYGGLFHDDVKPGHDFAPRDHRTFRPAGWVEAGNEKIERLRPIAERHGLTMLQLACAWDLQQPAVECVAPTLIQEPGADAKTIARKVDELAAMPDVKLTAADLAMIAEIGDNTGCMKLKGASSAFEGEATADQWTLDADLMGVAGRWGLALPG